MENIKLCIRLSNTLPKELTVKCAFELSGIVFKQIKGIISL